MSIVYYLIIILFSAIIHEYMHGWMADRLGDPTAKDAGRLTLNPLAHIDLFGSILMPLLIYLGTAGSMIFGYAKPVPFNPYNLRDQKYGSAKVAAAGPLANLIIAVAFGILLRFIPLVNLSLAGFLAIIVQINLILLVFNIIPIPPLDGSKVLAAFLPHDWQLRFLELERYGILLILIFVFFGFSFVIPIIEFLFRIITGY